MLVPNQLKCNFCVKIFCCAQCRVKHEINMHMAVAKISSCAICCGKELALSKQNQELLLDHVCNEHLPLRCNKCFKIFGKKSDFDDTVMKCVRVNDFCAIQKLFIDNKENENINYDTKKCLSLNNASVIDTKSTNGFEQGKQLQTPMSELNLRWKSKTPISEENISDCVSSIRNVSLDNSHNNIMYKTASPNKIIVRQTSTPMNRIIYTTVKQSSFDSISSSCQMSSINNSSSESDVSPPIRTNNLTSKKSLDRVRNKMPVAATPLRQVMSKSIQKAIVQHGIPQLQQKPSPANNVSSTYSPLDLRTTPVLRRAKNEFDTKNVHLDLINRSIQTSKSPDNDFHRASIKSVNIQISMKSATHTSITSSERLIDTVYETCKNFDELESQVNHVLHDNCAPLDIQQTPKIGILRKTTSFAERSVDDENDVWYTPTAVPTRSYSSLENRHNAKATKTISDDVVISSNVREKSENAQSSGGKIWSLVSSVIRLASFTKTDQKKEPTSGASLVKRCASFAGFLTNPTTNDVEMHAQPNKRRRTSTVNMPLTPTDSQDIKRTKRIHGRQPIERMRKMR